MMTAVEILSELEISGGWVFDVQVRFEKNKTTRHQLTLFWADYNLWSRSGSDPPHQVAKAVMLVVADQIKPEDIPAGFDAGRVRRMISAADELIPQKIGS